MVGSVGLVVSGSLDVELSVGGDVVSDELGSVVISSSTGVVGLVVGSVGLVVSDSLDVELSVGGDVVSDELGSVVISSSTGVVGLVVGSVGLVVSGSLDVELSVGLRCCIRWWICCYLIIYRCSWTSGRFSWISCFRFTRC